MVRSSNGARGERLRDARKAACFTTTQAGDAIGVSRWTIQRYETGAVDIPSDRLAQLAVLYGVAAELLLVGDDAA